MLGIAMFKSRQQGLSLVELIATIVILSIALAGVAIGLSQGLNRSGEAIAELQAVALAQSYLDEILGKRYDEKTRNRGVPPCRDPSLSGVPAARRCTFESAFGPDAGETSVTYSRIRWDDVDDYDGMDEGNGGANTMVDANGATRTDYDAFRVQVNVRYINLGISPTPLGIDPPAASNEVGLPISSELDDEFDAKLIVVTVSNGGLETSVEYSAFKSNF